MVVTQDDVNDLEFNLMELEGDVNFLFEETIIQDERLLTLEQENDVIDDELESEFYKNKTRNKFSVSFLITLNNLFLLSQLAAYCIKLFRFRGNRSRS